MLMKQHQLTESTKSVLDRQSTLRSELAIKERLVEELRKENEVNVCNYCTHLCLYNYRM